MTPEQVRLVQESFSSVEPIAEQAAQLFYGRLFEIAPQVRPLFANTNMMDQGKKLMQTLAVAVKSLNRVEEILPALHALGRNHVKYGVTAEHYQPVGAALLWTLEKGLGDAFTPEVKEAWTATYMAVASAMIEGAASATATA